MIFQLKQRLLDAIVVNGTVDCYIDEAMSWGFVTSNNPVKRMISDFKANFNLSKNWKHEKV